MTASLEGKISYPATTHDLVGGLWLTKIYQKKINIAT